MAYVSQTIANYNDDAPADDGSAVSTNKITWALVKDELADPIKTLAEGINSALVTAFDQLFLGTSTDKASGFAVSATNDDGKIFTMTGAGTVTLPAAATAGNGFTTTILNNSGGTITIDGDSSETINGETTVTLTNDDEAYILICNGTKWYGLLTSRSILADSSTFSGDNTFSGDTTFTGDVRLPDDGELTISSGAITVTGAFHSIDTESDAATDDLDTINGGNDGQLLIVRAENDARDVVLKDGTGNIETPDGEDITLDNQHKVVGLIYDNTLSKWVVVSQPPPSSVTIMAMQASTSGTDIDFTSIPAGVTKITIMFSSVSTSGTNEVRVRLGDAGGFETTGYESTTTRTTSSGQGLSNVTNGFQISNSHEANDLLVGNLTLTLMDAATFLWTASWSIGASDKAYNGGGAKALSAELTQVRITTVGGSDTFDAGNIGVQYE